MYFTPHIFTKMYWVLDQVLHFKLLLMYEHIESSHKSAKVDIICNSVWQTRKLRHKDVRWLTENCSAEKLESQDSNLGSLTLVF